MKLYTIPKQFLAVLILATCTFGTSAASTTIDFTGTLTSSFDILHSGDAFSGSYTYDPSVAGIPTNDHYGMNAVSPVGSAQIGGLDITQFGFNLGDSTMTAITDPLTLLNPPSLASFDSHQLYIAFGEIPISDQSKGGFLVGILETLSVRAVPVPAAIWLFASAMAGLIGFGRRNKSFA